MTSAPTLELRDHFGDDCCPSRLVTGANACAAAAVEIFIEQKEIIPLWIVLKQLHFTVKGSSSLVIPTEDADYTLFQLQRDLPQIEQSS